MPKAAYDGEARGKRRRPRRRRGDAWLAIIALALVPIVALAVERGRSAVGCDIKGNISFRTGERIYHVPGQKYYDATRISANSGERWFCSEDAARQAGWKKARL